MTVENIKRSKKMPPLTLHALHDAVVHCRSERQAQSVSAWLAILPAYL